MARVAGRFHAARHGCWQTRSPGAHLPLTSRASESSACRPDAMRAILPTLADHALHSVAQTRAVEQAALALDPRPPLMERAGQALARLSLALAPHSQRVWIAAGPGNNGGDGLEAALHLQRSGRQVDVTLHAATH